MIIIRKLFFVSLFMLAGATVSVSAMKDGNEPEYACDEHTDRGFKKALKNFIKEWEEKQKERKDKKKLEEERKKREYKERREVCPECVIDINDRAPEAIIDIRDLVEIKKDTEES